MGVIMIGYKLFRVKKSRPGELFPLYVLADEPVPIGVWVGATEGPRTPEGKVKSKIGPLAFRPGWHLSDIPLAIHIGIKEDGKIFYRYKTSPQMLGKWIITGSIRVLRVLSDEEVEKICAAAGYRALPRKTPFNAAEYGL